MPLSNADEYLHLPPPGSDALWSDNFWFSVCDREADVYGINHIHASLSHGYVRASAFYVIDGVPVQWASRQPLGAELEFSALGDGRVSFSVEEPFARYRWQLDAPRFGFDLTFEDRFGVFDYNDCFGGNPLGAYEGYGGHYEQALVCRGRARDPGRASGGGAPGGAELVAPGPLLDPSVRAARSLGRAPPPHPG